MLEVFDFPNPNIVAGRRNTSTLPAQALYLMNSPFAMDQAKHAAQRLLAVKGLDDGGRIELAYRVLADADTRRGVMAKMEALIQDEGVTIQPYWRSLYRHMSENLTGTDMHVAFEHHHYQWAWKA